MKSEQRVVAIGAATGVVLMTTSVWTLACILPVPMIAGSIADRLAYALGANVFAIIPFFVMLISVGNARFLSTAIDPMRHTESTSMQIDGRVVDNTLQQNFVFFVTTLALSTIVPIEYMQIIWALAIVFAMARCAFWYGYRLNPLYRAPGMAATAYMNLGIIGYVLFKTFFLL